MAESLFLEEIIEAIDFYQDKFWGHSLTCGNDSRHYVLRGKIVGEEPEEQEEVILYCPTEGCDYEQEWIPEYVFQVYRGREKLKSIWNNMGVEEKEKE
jgi:hypothetical protein